MVAIDFSSRDRHALLCFQTNTRLGFLRCVLFESIIVQGNIYPAKKLDVLVDDIFDPFLTSAFWFGFAVVDGEVAQVFKG